MKLGEIEAASKGNAGSLRRLLQSMEQWMTFMESNLGINPQAGPQAIKTLAKAPALADFEVITEGGNFIVKITNPPGKGGQVLHEVKASTTVPVNKSTDVIIRGPGPDTSLVIFNPATTRYFQLRSKYPYSDFNEAQVFGPVTTP